MTISSADTSQARLHNHVAGLVTCKANTLSTQRAHVLTLELPRLNHIWPFAKDITGTRRVKRLAVDLRPVADAVQNGNLFAVDGSIRLPRNIKNEGSVLAEGVDEPMDHVPRRKVAAVLARLFVDTPQDIGRASPRFLIRKRHITAGESGGKMLTRNCWRLLGTIESLQRAGKKYADTWGLFF